MSNPDGKHEDCDEVLGMLAEYGLLLDAERDLRADEECDGSEREELISHCNGKQHELMTKIEKHKNYCLHYNPNIFKQQ